LIGPLANDRCRNPAQLALAGWLMNELDRGPSDTRDPSEYTVSGDDQGTYRIVCAPFTKSLQDFQEAVTLVRSVEEIRRMFSVNTPRGVAMRGTPDQCAMAEWVFGELAKSSDTAPSRYQGRREKDGVTEVLRLQNAKTPYEFQEIAITIRTIGRIRYFNYTSTSAIALRGTPSEAALATWLAGRLDDPAKPAAPEFQIPQSPDNIVRVFFLPQGMSVDEFQQAVQFIRTRVGTTWVCTYNAPRALVMRGTSAQIALAQQLVEEQTQVATPPPSSAH
jgi:hypothetical protein